MCDTQYAFLQYFLLMPFDTFKDTFFIFDFAFHPAIVKNLEKAGMACFKSDYRNIPKDKVPSTMLDNQNYLEKLLIELKDYCKGNLCIYGQDHLYNAQIIWRENLQDIPFILLEDGTGNYIKREKIGRLPDFMTPDEYYMGHNSRVQDIYLTGIWRIPNDLKKKVKILDLKNLWNVKSDDEKQFFLNLYFINQNIIDEISKKTICYLGGPFSNIGMLTLEQELNSYRKIISHYNISDLYIKAHPTGFNIDYAKEFPGIAVLANPIPFEVIYFLTGRNLRIVATIFSTASFIVDENVEQHFYDINGNPVELKYPSEDLV